VELNTLLLPLGIIPAIFILYFVIRDYDGKYQEKNVVLLFIVGIVAGMIIYTMEGMIFYDMLSGIVYLNVIIFYSLLFSLVEQISKFAITNFRRFREDAPSIYGATFSLGFSTVMAPLLFGATYTIGIENLFLLLLPFSAMFFNAASGIFIGAGIRRKMAWKYFFFAFFAGGEIWAAIMLTMVYSTWGGGYAVLSLFPFFLSLIIFYYAIRYTLPYSMMERRELRRVERE